MKKTFDFTLTQLYIRLEKGLKADAEEVFCKLGINMSEAIRIYLKQVVVQKEIPFKITLSPYPFRDTSSSDPELDQLLKSLNS